MIGVFWTVGGLLMLVDITGRPAWVQRFKVQQEEKTQVRHIKWETTYGLYTQVFGS